MAKNVTIQALGGQPKVVEISKPLEGLVLLGLSNNYSCTVNGQPKDMDFSLSDYSFVTYTEKVKGGNK